MDQANIFIEKAYKDEAPNMKEIVSEIVPTYKEVLMAKHRGFTRHLKCP